MGRTACTEPQCLYKGDLYSLLFIKNNMLIFLGKKSVFIVKVMMGTYKHIARAKLRVFF